MKAIRIQVILLCLLVNSNVLLARERLHVGDTMPAKEWKAIPKKKNTKLVVLDFWGVGCSSCIGAFPKMEALQKQFRDSIDILLVTKNTKKQITELFTKPYMQDKKIPSLTSLTGDVVLSDLFPYKMVPQHVWLDSNGVVLAITSGYNTTEENIRSYLDGKLVRFRERNDLEMDRAKPLFTRDDLPEEKTQFYSLLIKGHTGLPAGTMTRTQDKVEYGRCWYNITLLGLYEFCARKLIHNYSDKQLLLEVKDTAKLLHSDYKDDDWKDTAIYTFDLIVPLREAPRLYWHMLYSLRSYTDYDLAVEKRMRRCFVLKRMAGENKLGTQGGNTELKMYDETAPRQRNGAFENLIATLNYRLHSDLLVVDETGYTGMADLDFDRPLEDLTVVREQLKRYNLELMEAEREVTCFVVKDKP